MEPLDIALWTAQALLALLFLFAGTTKAFRYESARKQMPWTHDVPQGTVRFIGAAEILGALGLFLPMAMGILPWLTVLAALGLATVMLLASSFHARRKETKALPMNALLLAGALFVAIGRWNLFT